MIVDLSLCFPEGADGSHKPLPKQKEFLDATFAEPGPKYVAYFGGIGSGKTMILCVNMLMQGVRYGGEYVIARQFAPELKRTTLKQFLEIVPPELVVEHRIADAEIHVKSVTGKPAIFYFVGLDEPGKLRSLNLSGFGIDEASQVSEEAFLLLQGRLRNKKGLRKGVIVGNPAGHNWIYRYFIKKDVFKTPEAKASYKLLLAPSTENVHLPDGYVASLLESYSAERVQREIMGSFDSFEGQIYNEFNRNTHVVRPFRIPDEWTKIVGVDHGYTNPASWIFGAVDYDGNIYIYKEYYESGKIIKDICRDVVPLLGHRPQDILGYIDPSTNAKRNERNGQKYSDYDIYLENLPQNFSLIFANNDVEAGIDKVKTYLCVNERTNKPKLFIFDDCINLLDEITQYRYEELSPNQQGRVNEKEKPRKYKDHAVDALRYLVMSRPDSPQIEDVRKKKLTEATMEASISRELNKIRFPKPKDPFGD